MTKPAKRHIIINKMANFDKLASKVPKLQKSKLNKDINKI